MDEGAKKESNLLELRKTKKAKRKVELSNLPTSTRTDHRK